MSETPPELVPTPLFADADDVRGILVQHAERVTDAEVAPHLASVHGEVLDRLGEIYGRDLPAWKPDAAEALRWAEAQLAAALWLDIARAMRPDASAVADKLRAAAYRTLASSLPGQPAGDATEPLPPGGGPVPVVPTINGPRVAGGYSNFPDPYAAAELAAWWLP